MQCELGIKDLMRDYHITTQADYIAHNHKDCAVLRFSLHTLTFPTMQNGTIGILNIVTLGMELTEHFSCLLRGWR